MFATSRILLGGLWKHSMVRCADNSGVIKGMIIGLGQDRFGGGGIGHRVRISPRDKTPECTVNKLPKGVIVRRRKETGRKDGSYVRFSDNAVCLLHKNKVRGNKVKGPVPMEVRHNLRTLARYVF